MVLRRPRLAAVRRDHPPARVLPDPRASGRSSTRAPPRSPRVTAADTLVELGSGTSEKTRLLLDALRDAGTLTRFVPFDVSETTLRDAAAAIGSEYPGVAVHAVVGDFERHLDRIPGGGRRLVAFLGGTIGNLLPDARGARSSRDDRRAARARRRVPARHRPRQGPGPARRRLRRRGGRHRGVQPQRAARARTASSAPTSTSTRSSTSRVYDAEQRVDRDAPAVDRRAGGAASARSDLVVPFARRRGDAHRGQRQVPPRAGRARARGRGPPPHRVVDRSRRRLRALALGALPSAQTSSGSAARRASTSSTVVWRTMPARTTPPPSRRPIASTSSHA